MMKTLTFREILYALTYRRHEANRLLDTGKSYDRLLKFLLKQPFSKNPQKADNIPSPEYISRKLGMSVYKIRSEVLKMYNDLWEASNLYEAFELSKDTQYYFYISANEKNHRVNLNTLSRMPRIGENIVLPYFQEEFGTENFHVKLIEYNHKDDKEVVYIWLQKGTYHPEPVSRMEDIESSDRIALSEFENNNGKIVRMEILENKER